MYNAQGCGGGSTRGVDFKVEQCDCVPPGCLLAPTPRTANIWNGTLQLFTSLIFFVPLAVCTIGCPLAGVSIMNQAGAPGSPSGMAPNGMLLGFIGFMLCIFGTFGMCIASLCAASHAMVGAQTIAKNLFCPKQAEYSKV